jgi:hypothetical protein
MPVSAGRQLSPRDPPFPEEVAAVLEELQMWYADAKDAVTAARDQMGRAAERFADFAASGNRTLRSGIASSGTLATMLFGAKGRMAGFLARILAEVLVTDPGKDIQARLARRLDQEKSIGNAEVVALHRNMREALRAAGTVESLETVRRRIRGNRPALVPSENKLFRDLLLELARDQNMRLSGSATNLAHEGRWWRSPDPDRPFQLDGTEVVDALNDLDQVDPGTRRTFDMEG